MKRLLPSGWRFAFLAVLGVSQSGVAANSGPLPPEIVIRGVEFVLIPAGEFWYTVGTGDPALMEPYAPQYRDVRVYLPAFYIAKHEARMQDYLRFLNESGSALNAEQASRVDCVLKMDASMKWVTASDVDVDLAPASGMSWQLAERFAAWMGFRLPTEAEWQKAARGEQDKRLWPWGDEYPDDTFAHFGIQGLHCRPVAVHAYPKGRSPYGVLNMAGNVAEWVSDWYSIDFDRSVSGGTLPLPATEGYIGKRAPDVPLKILKGGRWSAGPGAVTVPMRTLLPVTYVNAKDGVRFAVDVDTAVGAREEAESSLVRTSNLGAPN